MNQLNFDRAFPTTPDCIQTAIELGIRKGQKKMKFRNKIIAMGSIAAALAVLLAAALAMGIERDPRPDVLAQPPLDVPRTQEAVTVYSTDGADFYHAQEHCSGMEGAKIMTEREAIDMGKQPCPICIPLACDGHAGEEIEFVYYSQGGKYFHLEETCGGGVQPLKGDYFAVTGQYPGKEPCADCLPHGITTCLHGKVFVVEPTNTPVPEETTAIDPAPRAEEYVPVNTGGKSEEAQYHPVSLPPVYYNEGGTYYHSDEHCQGMMNAQAHSREEARKDRKSPCPICLNVYSTISGKYFHLLPDCIGMIGAELRSLEEAYALGKTRCPVCLSPETVYCTPKGYYFHAFSACSGMEGASPTDPEDAWNMDKDPCPVCITGLAHAMLSQQEDSEPSSNTQNLALLHEQLFQTAFGFLPEAKAKGYRFEEFSTEPYCWHLTDGDSYPINSALYTPGGDYDGYRVHMFSIAHPTVMRQIMEQVAVSPMMGFYSLGTECLKKHIINQGHNFSERDIDIHNILVKFDDAQRICGASIDFFYNQSIVSVAFTPENQEYLSWRAEVTSGPL